MKLYGPTNIFLSSDHMSFRDQSCVFINVVLRGWIWSQINIAKKEDWWGKVGEGRSLALLYYLPYAILGGPAVPAALRLPNFLETLSRRFRLFEVLRKWWCFFWKDCNQKIRVEHAFGRREESRKFQELEGFEAKCSLCAFYLKQWACFPFRICKEGSRVKRKIWSFVSLGPDWKKTGQLRISMISSFSSSSGCWSVHLFQHFPSLLWLWAISFHQINFNIFVHIFFKLSSISLHLTEMKIEVSLLLRGR